MAPSPAAPARRDLEAHLGTYWLSRVGIVALIIGIAYLITYRFGELGMLARVVAGYVLSAGLGALPNGGAVANAYGFATTARDLARFGLLILADGKWISEPSATSYNATRNVIVR